MSSTKIFKTHLSILHKTHTKKKHEHIMCQTHCCLYLGQAVEIGYVAINVLIKTWEGHLTPMEVASLADRASRCRDPKMVRAAAQLALSSLAQAQALNPTEIQRALIQCKEQSTELLERACLSVEQAAKESRVSETVPPNVLFDVARRLASISSIPSVPFIHYINL